MTYLFSSSCVHIRSGGGPEHENKKRKSEHLLQSYAEICVAIGPQHFGQQHHLERQGVAPPPPPQV